MMASIGYNDVITDNINLIDKLMKNGVIILAAGKGTRMRSNLPKVLHPVGGKPMVAHLTELGQRLGTTPIVVYGHGGEQLQARLDQQPIHWVEQSEQLGTGHAVLQTLPHLQDELLYFILVGDAPLIRESTLAALAEAAADSGIAVLTVRLDNPFGYGRIVRDDRGHVVRIVEEKDASEAEKQHNEINSGVFAVRGALLKQLLPQIGNDNAQGEYYLTDIVALANAGGHSVSAHCIDDMDEVLGCNNKVQLAALERIYQRRQAEQLMLDGATLADPDRVDIRGHVSVGSDCFIDVNAVFIGEVRLGNNVHIGPNCVIEDADIGDNSQIHANSIIERASVGEAASIGPFARLRPNTVLAANTKIGNFVETKNAKIAEGSKVNHLSYVGDALIAENVNVGAGTITCNYDGENKHQTIIEAGAFIGSNSALVAPVRVGENVTVAAGSTITKDAGAHSLTVARARQVEISDWKARKKGK